MDFWINISNGLAVLAFIALIGLVILIKNAGNDERTQFMGYKLFSFLYTFLLCGLALIIFITAWIPFDYVMLRVCITSLMSLNILIGLGYWIYISKKL
jgi:hypothetical protein